MRVDLVREERKERIDEGEDKVRESHESII
jgi:hypothetical protein